MTQPKKKTLAKKNYKFLQKIAFQQGINLFGIADCNKIKEEIPNCSYLIKDFKYGISMGYKLSSKIIESIENKPTKIYSYHYRQINLLLDQTALLINSFIQAKGFNSLPIPSSQVINWETLEGELSHKTIGLYAGLGWLGRNNLLVNSKYGSCVRYVSVLTDFPLLVNNRIENNCGSCKNCIAVCPALAIKMDEFDLLKCKEQLKIFSKEIGHHICGICLKVCQGNEEL